jgi:hypothetical protein
MKTKPRINSLVTFIAHFEASMSINFVFIYRYLNYFVPLKLISL